MPGNTYNLFQYRLFFFGSRVIGRGSERSDIDVGIEGSAPVLSDAMAGIQGAID